MERKSCETCALNYNGRCAEFDMPVKVGRHPFSPCGPDGNLHVPKPAPFAFVESWRFLAFVAIGFALAVSAGWLLELLDRVG